MNGITTNGLIFRWADEHLVVTTPKGQYMLDAQGTASLLDLLYAHRDAIFDAEAHLDGLASWARSHPAQQFVIGTLNPQPTNSAPSTPLSLEEGRARRRRNEEADA